MKLPPNPPLPSDADRDVGRAGAPIQQGPQGDLFKILTSVVRSQLPAIVASGAATEAEIDVETLEQRMIADAPPQGVVGYFNSGHVGVWARKP